MKKRTIALFCAFAILLSLTACAKESAQEKLPEAAPQESTQEKPPEAAPQESAQDQPPEAAPQESAQEKLLKGMAEEAGTMVNFTSPELNMYHNPVASADFSGMPASFDLRDQGIVPPVRHQGSWGTCWGFSIIAASEISLLSEMGLTTEEYEQETGEPLDLSEKHLAWFGNGALPALEEYPQGEYIYPGYESQAGEGILHINEETEGPNARYGNGGWVAYGAGMFSSGVGPAWEEDFPYAAADGTQNKLGDWSLPEEDRFIQGAELENSTILPSPAQRDAQGHYVYNELGTYAIKSELLAGRGVSIAYHADHAMDPEASIKQLYETFKAGDYVKSLDQMRLVDQFDNGNLVLEELTLEQARDLYSVQRRFRGASWEEAEAELETMSLDDIIQILTDYREEARKAQEEAAQEEATQEEATQEETAKQEQQEKLARETAEEIGIDYDELKVSLEAIEQADEVSYISTENYAQYTANELATINHAVIIVGWDDNYPAENFIEGMQPPADGAWIVRNSWGENYGIDGYFYLSYYDKTICAPETFDFVTEYPAGLPKEIVLYCWDFMPVGRYSSVHMDKAVQQANVFSFDDGDTVLEFVSVLTADLDVQVTADVYLLDEGAQQPDDGVLLDSVTKDFAYGGYHRIALNRDFLLHEGSRIGVVVTQRIKGANGAAYSLPYPMARNAKFAEAMTTFAPDSLNYDSAVGRIGKGESFVKVDDKWLDWADVVEMHRGDSKAAEYLSYDNFGIKAYTYLLEDIQEMHKFDSSADLNGMTQHLCSECSYSFMEAK